jgi:hypothetical protein
MGLKITHGVNGNSNEGERTLKRGSEKFGNTAALQHSPIVKQIGRGKTFLRSSPGDRENRVD